MTPEARALLARLAARPGAVATPGERRVLVALERGGYVVRVGVGVWGVTAAGLKALESEEGRAKA